MALQKHPEDPALERAITRIVDDHRSGATGIARAVLRLVEEAVNTAAHLSPAQQRKTITSIFTEVIAAHPQMGILYYLRDACGTAAAIDPAQVREHSREILLGIKEQQHANALAFAGHVSRGARIITLSHSSAVAAALAQAAAKKIKVIVAESRPKNEGRALARKLHDQGIHATLIVDAAMGLHVPDCDLVLVGADAVTPEFFVNKIGTLALSLLARDKNIPVFVLTDTYRLLAEQNLSRRQVNHPAGEIITRAQPYALDNHYFDFVPLQLVHRIICNGRILTTGKLF